MSKSGDVLLLSIVDPLLNLELSGGSVHGLEPERHASGRRWIIGFLLTNVESDCALFDVLLTLNPDRWD